MHITFSPVRRDDSLTLEQRGDALVVNGEVFDFAPLPEGATLTGDAVASEWIVGTTTRRDGVVHVTVLLPHGAGAGQAMLYPSAIDVKKDGAIALPSDTQANKAETPA